MTGRSANEATLSVIIPTYNRRRDLERTLDAYRSQDQATPPFEVVVIDDGSSDDTVPWLASRRETRYRLITARQTNQGPAAARNQGIALATGNLVLFTGDDIEPASDLLLRHIEAHDQLDDPSVAILGLTRWRPGPLTATMRHIDGIGAQQFSYHYFEDGTEYDFRHFYTSNVSIRRALLDREPDGFSIDFPSAAFEDAELGHRLASHGLRIVYRAEAVAVHHHDYTADTFFARQVRCGAMAAILWQQHPELETWLGIRDLRRLRTAVLRLPAIARHRLDREAEQLDIWQRRALSIATALDPVDPPGIDTLLSALFSFGYRRGLAEAILPPVACRRLLSADFRSQLPAVARQLADQLNADGLVYPPSDLDALSLLLAN